MDHPLFTALDSLLEEDDVASALWASLDILDRPGTARVGRDTERLVRHVMARHAYRDDFLFHVTALGLMGRVGGPHALRELLRVASSGDPAARPYSALALTGNVTADAVPILCGLLRAEDPFTRMAAQEALVSLAPGTAAAATLTSSLMAVVIDESNSDTRIAAIECILPVCDASPLLQLLGCIVSDRDEPNGVREAARRALGRLRPWSRPEAEILAREDRYTPPPSLSGWRIAQLTTASTSGLQTLTSGLAAAFLRRADVARVLNISYGPGESVAAGGPHIHVDSGGPVMWDHRVRIEREMDQLLHLHRPHVLHLRFADVGTIAAARSARRQGIDLYFTFAPDPIVPMRLAARRGNLTRATLRDHDVRERLIFRTGVLHHMTRCADGMALLPRDDDTADRLLSRSFGGPTRRIAEGIELPATAKGDHGGVAETVLDQAFTFRCGRGFAPRRRGLPLLVTVGRLHPAKGMAALVETWATNPDLVGSTNLAIIGGDLTTPNGTERAVLDDIERIMSANPAAKGGLVLTGAVPHRGVPPLLEVLKEGIEGVSAPRAVYVCASPKEEFGLAILEALAAGLAVVAPRSGGPSTYLRDGILGFMADTTDRDDLARVLRQALVLRKDAAAYLNMGALGQGMVRTRYSIDRMADELIALYGVEGAAALSSAS